MCGASCLLAPHIAARSLLGRRQVTVVERLIDPGEGLAVNFRIRVDEVIEGRAFLFRIER